MYTTGNVFRRHWRLISLVLGIIALFWLLYALRTAVLPFILGLVLAYLLLPVITWVEKKLPRRDRWQQTKRVFLILLVFIVLLGLIGVLSFYIVTAVANAVLSLLQNAPQFIGAGMQALQQWTETFREQLPPEIWQQVDSFLVNAGVTLGTAVQDAFLTGVSQIPSTLGMFFGFAALPLFLFYVLKDAPKLKRDFYSALPSWLAEHTRNIVSIIETVLGRYIRAQLLLAFIVAYLTFIGLWIMKVPFAPALAVLAGITEVIPTIGPWIGGAVAVIVTLAVAPDKAIWVVILFLVVQLLENNLLVPRIQGAYLRIHPAVLIFLLVLAAYIAGFWGLVLVAPLTATAVAIYKYVRGQMKTEEAA